CRHPCWTSPARLRFSTTLHPLALDPRRGRPPKNRRPHVSSRSKALNSAPSSIERLLESFGVKASESRASGGAILDGKYMFPAKTLITSYCDQTRPGSMCLTG